MISWETATEQFFVGLKKIFKKSPRMYTVNFPTIFKHPHYIYIYR